MMIQFNASRHSAEHKVDALNLQPSPYTRDAFRAILARQPEWKVRAALEEGNIPSSNIEHAVEWLEEQEQTHQHQGCWS
jgi:aminoglycoside phosphotransferase (APT) family kinase protein